MKFLSTLLLAALLPLSAGAQTYLGYTTLQYERNKGVGFSTSEATHGVAIRVPESKMQLLKGKRITGLRAAFSTRKLSELRIFATHDLTATPVAEALVSGASTSVVEFDFDQPITIDGQPLFLGYKATLSNAEGGKPCLFDEAADLPTGYVWGYADGAWIDVSNRGLGAPILQFVVEGSADFTDVLVKPVNVQGYCKAGSDISLQGEIFNFGTTPITSLTLQTAVGDAAASQQEVTGLNVAPGAVHTYSLEGINASQPGALDLRLEVPTVNGQTDAEPADNAVTSQVFLYPANVQKRLLLENFTGQTCSNCPSGHESINTAIMGRTDDFVIVAHHAGYAPDLFTMAEDVEYTWLYNLGGSIYAPAVTINRLPYTEGASSVVFGNTTALYVTLPQAIATADARQPYVSVEMENAFNEADGTGTVTVYVHTFVSPSTLPHALNVWLTQDGIVANQANGGTSYVHDHAFRGTLNGSTWGESIELIPGETVTRTIDYTIPASITSSYANNYAFATDPSRMQIVAFVSDASESALECAVHNANAIGVTTNGTTSGISQATGAASAPQFSTTPGRLGMTQGLGTAQVFDAAGRRVGSLTQGASLALPAGVYVVRCGAHTAKWMVK